MAITPPTYTPSGSLFGSAAPSTPAYTYGNLGNTTSDYSLWGSRGNPYLVAGPTYTPGSGLPINPHPLTPIAPPSNGGSDSDYVPPTTGGSDNGGFWGEDSQGWGDLTTSDKALLGPISLYGDFAYGRMDVPGGGYARLPWYEGSAGNGYGYTKEGYDQFAPGDSDRGIYDASTGERAWDDSFDDYNTGDLWAETGVFEGIGNIFGGRTWDGAEGPTIFGQEAPVASTPRTFGNTNSVEAVESRANIANEKARVANNIAAIAAEEARAARVTPSNPYGFAPNDVVTGDTGTWTNPAANTDTSTLSGSTGTTNSSFTNDGSGGVSFSSDETGTVSGTDYGNGQYGFTDTNGEEVGYESPDSGGDSGGGGGGGSYIATAATQALGKEGLDMFEGWRDYMHTAHPTFTTSYGRYRVTAPKIVSAIDKKTNSKELYQDIWNEYLKPIFGLIKKDMNNPKALSDYKVMVKELTNKYLKGDK